MNVNDVRSRIESAIPGAEATAKEFSGGGDHFEVMVVYEGFAGKTSLARHRLIMDLFQTEIRSGEVHALAIKTFTPAQWKELFE